MDLAIEGRRMLQGVLLLMKVHTRHHIPLHYNIVVSVATLAIEESVKFEGKPLLL